MLPRHLHALARIPALCLLITAPALARPDPLFHLIARSGEAFPGRDGYTYEASLPFLGARSNDPAGDIYFLARGRNPAGEQVSDLLVYRRATGGVETFVRSGDPIDGTSTSVSWGTVGGAQQGVMSYLGRIADGTPGDAQAVIVTRPDGSRTIMAREGQQAPGHAQPAPLTDVGLASGSFLDINMNASGDVSYGARFRDASNIQRYGYYLTRADGSRERIIDSTMPVPNHPTAQWVSYDNISAPFDIYTPGLDAQGDAYFKAKFRLGGKDYRAFYKRAADGSITPIIDAAEPDAVPGLPGYSFTRLRSSVNNQRGDTAFCGEIVKPDGAPFGAGVFAKASAGPLTKVLAFGDPVPGIPEAQNHVPGLIAMGNSGHQLLTVNYFLTYPTGSFGGQSLVLYNPDGTAEPVLKFDQTPGFPGERAGLCSAADVNSRGDVVFITRMNLSQDTYFAGVYLNDTDVLVPILKTGDTLLGLKVVSFTLGGGANEPLGSIGASAGPVCWDDQRLLSLSVVLKDATGKQSTALYSVQVPAPAAAAILPAALLAASRRRPRIATDLKGLARTSVPSERTM